MTSSLTGFRFLAVHAHPDDEASKGAATMASYVARGARVRVATCTGGERGSILNPKLVGNEEILRDLVGQRRREMAASARALSVEHTWLGFIDSGLPEGDPLPPLPEGSFATLPLDQTVPVLVKEIREFRPHVMTTYNEMGGYPHPDHIMTHRVSVAAFAAAADPEYCPDLGDPWAVQKLYYDVSFNLKRARACNATMRERGLAPAFDDAHLQRIASRSQRTVSAMVKASDYFLQRDAALRAHATQIDPDGFFFAIPRDIEREVWPWESFELAAARVALTTPQGEVETSLFKDVVLAGIDAGPREGLSEELLAELREWRGGAEK